MTVEPIEIRIDGEPITTEKMAAQMIHKNGKAIAMTYPRDPGGKAKAWRRAVKQKAELHMRMNNLSMIPADIPLQIGIIVWRTRTTTYRKSDRYPYKKPDLDNFVYIVVNALSGIVYHDDAQIVEKHEFKMFATDDIRPGVEIRIKEADIIPRGTPDV